ncbi:DUF1801 domain-containing protein [Microbacterium sp. C7(2022)]|uniref:DUF1801 domain-containing protein n=1 Tax=Microbacterium sp. C7(2022) TaxID=2992759 RepID=UPI00237AE928|nr:DUF1801 domain-containing protein [Microbacterium sp. C7(2022)]MDE0546535.1 DUF1801 domain-containing protein [Microbacterium sp. C7(2022)]
MQKTGGSVGAFIAGVTPAKRQRDAETVLALMSEITGREPELWGTIVGFGSCHYRYPTGNEGDMPVVAFAPRKQATTIYLNRTDEHADDLSLLGPHTTGVGCLYIKDVEAVDLEVLRRLIVKTEEFVRRGGDSYAQITLSD